MKRTARKLLSLMMALAIVLSLAPTAWAAGETGFTANGDPYGSFAGSMHQNIAVNETATLALTYTPTGNHTADEFTLSVSTNDTSIVQITNGDSVQLTGSANTGYTANVGIKGLAEGTATISVSAESTEGTTVFSTSTFQVTVTPAPTSISSIAAANNKTELSIGESTTLTATLAGTTTGATVTWTIPNSASSYLEFEGGSTGESVTVKVPATARPTTDQTVTVTATVSGENASNSTSANTKTVNITVKAPTVNVTPNTRTVAVGSTLTLTSAVNLDSTLWDTVVWTTTTPAKVELTQTSTTSQSVTVAGVSAGEASITVTYYDGSTPVATTTITVTVSSPTLSLAQSPQVGANNSYSFNSSYWSYGNNGYYYYSIPFVVTPSMANLSDYDVYYTWYLIPSGYTASSNNIVREQSKASGANSYTLSSYWYGYDYDYIYNYYGYTLRCDVEVYPEGTTTLNAANRIASSYATWVFSSNYASGSNFGTVTVYDTNPGYDLMDTPDSGNTGSIASQIDSWVYSWLTSNGYNYNGYYRDYRVNIAGGTRNANDSTTATGNYGTLTSSYSGSWLSYSELDKIVFVPHTYVSTANGYYTITYPVTIRPYYNDSSIQITGYITFKVVQGTYSSGDIYYGGKTGKDVTFVVEDFEDFWTNRYSNGYLTSVSFSSPTGTPSGTVYNSSNKAAGSSSYYVSSSGSSGLSGVYFSPSSSSTGTVSIRFTATGQTSNSSSSTYTTTLTGTVVITYLNTAADKITYATNSAGWVTLAADDFIKAYQKAMNVSTTPSNLSIQFQEVPTYGTLTYTGGSKDVSLTNSNVKSYKFNARTSGTYQIGDVTYAVSGSRNDTISYIGYIGSTATFTGEVTFNAVAAPEDVKVTYSCTSATGISLSSTNFTSAHSAMSSATYVILGNPRTGKLTYSGGSATSALLISSLNSVTYTPSTAVTGTATTDSFIFTAYNSSSIKVASGTVTININLPAAPSNPGAVTNINQFTDIPAAGGTADWYRTPLIYLINKGVINGQGNGKFGPEDNVEYSAALKFILNAAGIVEAEVSTPGVNWAQNYKNRAVNAGWISSDVDLTKPIPRAAMVELAAKALGVPASSATNPFTDTTNQWAVALYYTTPRIITGSNDLNGKLVFQPNSYLRRNEMVSLVYRMYQYRESGSQYNYDET